VSVTSGYAGGERSTANYQQVASGTTTHVEVVKINFDPQIISYQNLLEVFFALHDPTTINQQGADRGLQYRSIIFYMNTIQKQEANNFILDLESSKVYQAPIVTTLVAFTDFFEAEIAHQNYYLQNQTAPYCQLVISPKLNKLTEKFSKYLK
jgi:peptide-methionine (S)-S-oxide reductase